jgi:putative flippase GtrA
MMLKRVISSRKTQGRFGRFIVVGGVTACVQFSTLMIFKRWLSPNFAFTLSFICALSTHYTLNRFWALRSVRQDTARQFVEYLFTAGLSYLINIVLFRIGFNIFGLSVMWAALAAFPPSTLIVFVILNYHVFRHQERAE